MSITNGNEPTQPTVETTGEIPHSGVNFDEQPVDIFDNTQLHEADEQGLIGPVPETVPPAIEQPLVVKSPSKTKLYVGAGTAALALAGGAFLFLNKGDKPVEATTPVATSTTAPSPTTEATTAPVATPEAVSPDELPVFITGTTPEQIIQQYAHNKNCSLNAETYERQVACLTYNIGAIANSGTLGPSLIKTINDVNAYRVDHPGFTLTTSFEIQDSKMIRTQLEVVVAETDHAGTYYRYMRFNRTTATTENLTVDGATEDIWLLRETRNVQPGEVTFG